MSNRALDSAAMRPTRRRAGDRGHAGRRTRALRGYHLLPSVRGDLLERFGRRGAARAEFQRAAAMTANTSERAHLLARAAACG